MKVQVAVLLAVIAGAARAETVCLKRAVPGPTMGGAAIPGKPRLKDVRRYTAQIDELPEQDLGKGDSRIDALAPGKHLMRIRADGKLIESFSFTFEAGPRLVLTHNPDYASWSLTVPKTGCPAVAPDGGVSG